MLGRVQCHAADRVAGARERPDAGTARPMAQTGVGVDGDALYLCAGCGGEVKKNFRGVLWVQNTVVYLQCQKRKHKHTQP